MVISSLRVGFLRARLILRRTSGKRIGLLTFIKVCAGCYMLACRASAKPTERSGLKAQGVQKFTFDNNRRVESIVQKEE